MTARHENSFENVMRAPLVPLNTGTASGPPSVVYGFLVIASILFAYWLCYHTPLDRSVEEGGLVGPDSLTRILWVQQLVTTGGWFDAVLERFNAPYGMAMHWTRPMDLAILALAYPIHWIADLPLTEAVHMAGLAVSPVLSAGVLIAYALVLRLWGMGAAWMFMPAMFLLQPTLALQFAWGRPDHHSLQLLCVAILAASFALIRKETARVCGFWAALAVLVSVWISPEGLVPAALAMIFLGVGCGFLRDRPHLQMSEQFVLWIALLTPLALLIERGPQGLLEPATERFSILQGLFLGLGCGGILLARYLGPVRQYRLSQWVLVAGYVTAAIVTVLATGIVRFSHKSYIDPRTRDLLFDNNREFVPLLSSHYGTGEVFHYLAAAILTFGCAVWVLWRGHLGPQKRVAVVLLLAAIAFYGAMSLFVSIRWAAYTQIIGFLAVCALMHLVLERIGNTFLKLTCSFGLILLPIAGSVASASDPPAASDTGISAQSCYWPAAGSALKGITDRDGHGRPTVLATMFRGPQVAWFANAKVIAGPYAQPEPLIDTYNAFSASGFGVMQDLVQKRGIDAILVCQHQAEEFSQSGPDTVHARLQRGDGIPAWLERVNTAGGDQHGLAVYRVTGSPG